MIFTQQLFSVLRSIVLKKLIVKLMVKLFFCTVSLDCFNVVFLFLSFIDLTEKRKVLNKNLMKSIKILLKIQIKNLELFSLKWYSIMFFKTKTKIYELDIFGHGIVRTGLRSKDKTLRTT